MIEAESLIPCQTLGVGFTGHRLDRLANIDLAALRTTITDVFAAIELAVDDLASGDRRLICGMASGADMIASEIALQRKWDVNAVLPFEREEFESDFPAAQGRQELRKVLSAASAVFELAGDRGKEGAAYERVGRVILAQADLLVAVWDGEPGRGAGGTMQVVADAVLSGIPVVHIDPAGTRPPLLLWDRLEEYDLGQQTIDTVPRAGLDRLPRLVRHLLAPPDAADERAMLDRFVTGETERPRWFAVAYPLLLGLVARGRPPQSSADNGATPDAVDLFPAATRIIDPRFKSADISGSALARLFRSGYVTNFAFGALAVLLSLLGLVLPAAFKPLLIAGEVFVIATILVVTSAGNRAQWHRRWLDHRHLAERLRVLSLGAKLGDLDLRAEVAAQRGWVGWYARATARQVGLPTVRVDQAYLAHVRVALECLLADQIAYLTADAERMHRLEHRLHKLGEALFAITVAVCVALLIFKLGIVFGAAALDRIANPVGLAATIVSAALPAVGAAIYAIRMQGDFAGTSDRNANLAEQLAVLKTVVAADALDFDTLTRRIRRAADLLTQDLAAWLRTYHARPLALPG